MKNLPIWNGHPDSVKTGLKNIGFSSLYQYNGCPAPCPLSKAELRALIGLSKRKELVIQKSDKGNSIVILKKDDYVSKVNNIVLDSAKFTALNVVEGKELNFMISCENNLRKTMDSCKSLNKQDRDNLVPSGSRPGRLYGLAKIHKKQVPMRPILSAIGTPTYKLAKFLVPIIAPITINEYTVRDSFTFAKEISDSSFNFPEGIFMTSFDAESLFTNIPLTETVDICANSLYGDEESSVSLNREDFKTLLSTAVRDVPFIFNGNYYKQTDGVAMGSPLGPSLANAFLAFHEKHWLDSCPEEFKPLLYRRYVDDTFVVFREKGHAQQFLDYLNSQHPCMKFTHEVETGGKLNFLDITVEKTGNGFATSIYRKPTFSGLYSHFDSFIPEEYKKGLIMTLLYRAFQLSSNYLKFDIEVKFLKTILQKNGYPLRMIDQSIRDFLNKKFCTKKSQITMARPKVHLLMLPYTGFNGILVKRKLHDLVRRHLPQVELRIIFRPSTRVSMLFGYKDRLPKCLRSRVVYKYVCAQCKSAYIGSTARYLHKRISEHIGVSHLTGKVLKDPKDSPVFSHMLHCEKIRPSFDDFTVIHSSSTEFFLRIMESICITYDKPVLNSKIESLKLDLF